jgi:hypothetical protein
MMQVDPSPSIAPVDPDLRRKALAKVYQFILSLEYPREKECIESERKNLPASNDEAE